MRMPFWGPYLASFLVLTVAGFAGGAEPSAAPPGTALTLQQAIDVALAGNHQLGASEAQAAAADAGTREARSYRLPKIELSETYSRTTNPVYVFMNLLGQEAFGPADFDPAFLNTPPATNNFNTKVSVTQPIYAGGKIGAGVAAAGYAAEAAGADRDRTRQQVIHQVVEAYSGAVLAASHLGVAEEALSTAKAHVKLVQDLRETGMVVESDLLEARVRQGEIEEQVVEARSMVEVARAGLNMVMGRPLDEQVALSSTIELPPAPGGTLDELTAEAVRSRRDLAGMDRRVRAAGEMVRMARSGELPEVGVTGMYELNKENYPGRDGSNWSVFVGAKWTPFDGGGTGARLARARAEQRAAEQGNELMRQAAGLDVRKAWYALASARQRVDIAGTAVAQAQAALSIVEDRYKEGLATVVELLSAQTAVTAARTREISARRDVLLGRATLDLATGRL
jgi:outer membrane protein